MKKSICVAVGGALGTLTRYALFQIPLPGGPSVRPLITLLINVTGSFLLGFLVILFVKRLPVNAELRLGVTAGFLGGFTTFSTMCRDAFSLLDAGNIIFAGAYLIFTLLLGFAAAWAGVRLGKRAEQRGCAS